MESKKVTLDYAEHGRLIAVDAAYAAEKESKKGVMHLYIHRKTDKYTPYSGYSLGGGAFSIPAKSFTFNVSGGAVIKDIANTLEEIIKEEAALTTLELNTAQFKLAAESKRIHDLEEYLFNQYFSIPGWIRRLFGIKIKKAA